MPGWNPLADFQRTGNSTHGRRRTHIEEVGRPCTGQTVTRDLKEDLEKPVQVGTGGCPIQLLMSTHAANKPLDQGLCTRSGREDWRAREILVIKYSWQKSQNVGAAAKDLGHRGALVSDALPREARRHLFWKPASSRDTRERGE